METRLFEGFVLSPSPSLLGNTNLRDDLNAALGPSGIEKSGHDFKQPRLAKHWVPPKVTEGVRVPPYQDFAFTCLSVPSFSARACEALREFLEPNGELLPLDTEVGEYFVFNITTYSDALIQKNCVGNWLEGDIRASTITQFAFDAEKLRGLSIFRIFELPVWTIVSDAFVKRVYEHGLNGFYFTRIWPFPRGVRWDGDWDNRMRTTPPLVPDLREQFVIKLPLESVPASKPEKKNMKQLEAELKVQLAVPSPDAPTFGVYLKKQTRDHQYHMIVACPNAKALALKLKPWLKSLNWPCPATIVQRHQPNSSASDVIIDVD